MKFLSLTVFLLFFSLIGFTQERPRVVAIYPTTDSIPVNILRFYVEFSAPMQEMDILKHIHLNTAKGRNITGVFFENQYELWNEARTKVTLIVDPGRVKLGLLANNKLGRAFDEGEKYTLTVDSLLLDFNDQKLSKAFAKTFVAIEEDKMPPNTKLWKLGLPKSNSKSTLTIDFQDKIDHLSAQTLIKVFRGKKAIKGNISLTKKDQKWVFKPVESWKKGKYQILVSPQLEDIVANGMNQIFDHKLSEFQSNNTSNFILNFTIK